MFDKSLFHKHFKRFFEKTLKTMNMNLVKCNLFKCSHKICIGHFTQCQGDVSPNTPPPNKKVLVSPLPSSSCDRFSYRKLFISYTAAYVISTMYNSIIKLHMLNFSLILISMPIFTTIFQVCLTLLSISVDV